MKKVWECNSELAKAAANIRIPSSDGAVERFDGEDGSFSWEDFWMGMNYTSRKGGEIRQIAKAVECGMVWKPCQYRSLHLGHCKTLMPLTIEIISFLV